MSQIRQIGWKRGGLGLSLAGLLIWAAIRLTSADPEIALIPGEPWEDMRQRSSAAIEPAIPGHYFGRLPKSDARLRLADPQYGFVTPLARYLAVRYDSDRVGGVRMSPQIEPLLLDDTLKVVLDLQDQWRKAGWESFRGDFDPPFADTPEWRARLQDVNRGSVAYWRAGDKYQVMLIVGRFRDERYPTEERYLMTLALGAPW